MRCGPTSEATIAEAAVTVAVLTVWGLSSAHITVPDKPPVNLASIIFFALVNSYELMILFVTSLWI